MADNNVEYTTHAKTNFDPEEYINMAYSTFTGDRKEDEMRKFNLDSMHAIFKDGTIRGKRLLDLGTGPVCVSVFAASRWFDEIVLSDISEPNLAVLRHWKAGKRRHSLEGLWKYMTRLENEQDDWIESQERLAQKVRHIVRADMRDGNMLAGTEAEGMQFDAITMMHCQTVASTTLAAHRETISNYSKLLKPGGYLVSLDGLDGYNGPPSYQVGKYQFRAIVTTKEEFQEAVKQQGYTILAEREQFCHYTDDEGFQITAMVARKD